jgi:dTDP-glucose pyrophosphorylase
MSSTLSLVVMAAGGGTRYGGLKQLAPVGPNGESIMEYSLFDALKGGAGRVVLVVRPEHRQAFDEKFVDRLKSRCEVRYALQTLDRFVPSEYGAVDRPKPWGTAHALLCARDEVDGPFAVINADDFYGPTALAAMFEYLEKLSSGSPLKAAMVGYPLRNTLSDFGAVSRGVCELTAEGKLARVVERHKITRAGEGGSFVDEQGVTHETTGDETVSMNLWGFPREILDMFYARFHEFLAARPAPEKEFEIPGNVQRWIDAGELEVEVLPTREQWCGLTYPDDLPVVLARVNALVASGRYPETLW